MNKKFLLLALLSILLCGCANLHHMLLGTEVKVQLDTVPATAKLYLNGRCISENPSFRITRKITDIQYEAGLLTIDVPEARWPSGSITPQSKQTIYLNRKHHTIRIHHPDPSSIEGAFDQQSSHFIRVHYRSEPGYALVVNEHTNLGRTPVSCTYSYTFEDYKNGTLTIAPMRAIWPSGAVAETGSLTLDLKRTSIDHTFVRPEHPGLEQDLDAVWRIEERERAIAADRAQQQLLLEHHRQMEGFERQRIRLEKERLALKRRELEHRHDQVRDGCSHCQDHDLRKKQRH